MGLEQSLGLGFIGILVLMVFGLLGMIVKCFHQVTQGTALIRNGIRGAAVSFTGMVVLPIVERIEMIDLSVKTVEIDRHGKEGLVCKDNLRADLKVRFFVRVNNNEDDVLHVAKSLGCRRASDITALVELFEAKFSEALKTVGKQFNFVDLYTERQQFKDGIIKIIGTDLNGYKIEDAAIDFLEQTPVEVMNPNNILDCEGIKKINEITAQQAILANQIQREKEMTIVQQNVKAREAILELERQQAEAEQKQKREILSTTARETADANKVQAEERLKAERARITADEEIAVAEENKNRQIVVAAKNRERTSAVETERVEKDRQLEVTEREKLVGLAQIERSKAIETEQKIIQDVIRQRMAVQRVTAEEEQKIFDTQEIATAERAKKIQIIKSEMEAEQSLVKEIKKAEASRKAAAFAAEELEIEAEAARRAAEKEAEAKKLLAKGAQAEAAAPGLAEAQVLETRAAAIEKQGTAEAAVLERKAMAEAKGIEARAAALEKQGTVEANVLQMKATAEAKGIEAKADALKKQGATEADVMQLKYSSEAKGIEEKANAMKLFDAVGRQHEEFKLRLAKDKEVELAQITISRDVAGYRANVMSEALRSAHIDIIGGEQAFFDRISGSVAAGKAVDHFVESSHTLKGIRDTFFTGDPAIFTAQLKSLMNRFHFDSEDIKNLSVAAVLGRLLVSTQDEHAQATIKAMLDNAQHLGIGDKLTGALLTAPKSEPRPGKNS